MPRGKSKSRKKTRKINGKTYTLDSCRGAKTRAKSLRAKGFTARVVDGCCYKGPKKKKARRKRRR